MSVVQGIRGVGVRETENSAKRAIADVISQIEPNVTPMCVILTKVATEVVPNSKFEHLTDTMLPRFDTLAAALTDVATTMTVNNYAYFRENDLVVVNKSEIVRVLATPTSSVVSIARAQGTVAATAAAISMQLHIIGSSYAEGADLADALSTVKVDEYNYTQEIRNGFGVSTRMAATLGIGVDDEYDYQAALALAENKKSLEFVMLRGERKYIDSTRQMSGGILWNITSNSFDMGGALTEAWVDDKIGIQSRYTQGKRLLLLGARKVIGAFAGIAKEKLQLTPQDSAYGLRMHDYISPDMDLSLMRHYLLENDSQTDISGLATTAVVVDVSDLTLCHLANQLFHREDFPRTKTAAKSGEIATQAGLRMGVEKRHAEWTGITG